MPPKTTTKLLYFTSKIFCTVAYNFDRNIMAQKSKNNKIYILRILLFAINFIVGNFFTDDVISTGSLDEITFLLANVLLISLTIYLMIWSITTQDSQLKIIQELPNQDINLVIWIEMTSLGTYLTSVGMVVGYKSNYDFLLTIEYLMFFVLPDVCVYTVIFQFVNTVICLKQKFRVLNEQASPQSQPKDLGFLVRTYQELYLLSVAVNKCYGLICLWTVATFFLWIMCDMYRFVNVIIMGTHEMDKTLISSLVSTSGHYLAILVMAAVCASAKEESQRFKILFSRAVLESETVEFSKKKKLCLTLVHQNVKFTALDWFEVNYLLFYTMTGSIITYLVVLQQLDL